MTELKCPFCQQELEPIGTSGQFQCGTLGCDASFNFIATRDVWEYIDRTHKALDVAVEELTKIKVAAESVGIGFFMTAAIFALAKIKTALEQKDVK